MGQQVRHAQHRVVSLFADGDGDGGSVLFDHDAVKGQREGHPLVFFNTSVIVSIQESQAAVFKKGILLEIQTGRVDVSAQNPHSVKQRAGSHPEDQECFFHHVSTDQVSGAGDQFFLNHVGQRYAAGGLQAVFHESGAFPFCLAGGKEFFVVLTERIHRREVQFLFFP